MKEIGHLAGEFDEEDGQHCVLCGEQLALEQVRCSKHGATVTIINWKPGAIVGFKQNGKQVSYRHVPAGEAIQMCDVSERGDYEHERQADEQAEDWGLPELDGWR